MDTRAALRAAWAAAAALAGFAAAVHAQPFAYVPTLANDVAVVDVATHQVVQRIALSSATSRVAARPGAARVYVTHRNTDVQVIDAGSQSAVTPLPATSATDLALSPTEPKIAVYADPNFYFSLDQGRPAIQFFETHSRRQLGVVPLADTVASRMAFSGDGSLLFLADVIGNRIQVIDAGSYRLRSPIALPDQPSGLWSPPGTNRVYVAVPRSNLLRLVDGGTGATLLDMPMATAPFDVVGDAAGNRLYVSSIAGDAITVLDARSHAVVANVPVFKPRALDITPDGAFLYVSTLGGDGLPVDMKVISTQTLSVVATVADTRSWVGGRFIGGPDSPPAPTGPYSGLFWNPAENGWGLHLTQRRNSIFAAWFTYGPGANAHWYVADNCPLGPDPRCPTCPQQAYCEGTLIETRGPDIQQEPFRPADVTRGGVGTFKLRFDSFDRGTLSFTLYGEAEKSVAIQRQMFGSGPIQGTNFTDLWWNPDESGWGLGITHQGSLMFLTWFVYDANRLPGWYIASRCEVTASGDGCRGRLYRTSGPRGPRTAANGFEPERLVVDDVGSVELRFTDANSAVMSYILRGATQTKTIRRQFF